MKRRFKKSHIFILIVMLICPVPQAARAAAIPIQSRLVNILFFIKKPPLRIFYHSLP